MCNTETARYGRGWSEMVRDGQCHQWCSMLTILSHYFLGTYSYTIPLNTFKYPRFPTHPTQHLLKCLPNKTPYLCLCINLWSQLTDEVLLCNQLSAYVVFLIIIFIDFQHNFGTALRAVKHIGEESCFAIEDSIILNNYISETNHCFKTERTLNGRTFDSTADQCLDRPLICCMEAIVWMSSLSIAYRWKRVNQ